jgi:hypothetical protein
MKYTLSSRRGVVTRFTIGRSAGVERISTVSKRVVPKGRLLSLPNDGRCRCERVDGALLGEATLVALRAKILSKMEVAKFFAGFISVVFGFFVQGQTLSKAASDGWVIIGLYVSVAAFTAALALSVATMCAYDRLLMPFELWLAGPFDWKEGSESAAAKELSKDEYVIAIHRDMRVAWRAFFVPAIETLFIGLVAASYAAASAPLKPKSHEWRVYPVLISLIAAAVAIVVHRWYRYKSDIVRQIFPPLKAEKLDARSVGKSGGDSPATEAAGAAKLER